MRFKHPACCDDVRPLVDSKLSAGLECGIIHCGIVEKPEDDFGCVAWRNWSGTLQGPNAKPVRMAADDEMGAIAFSEWTVPAAIALRVHDESNENTRLGLFFVHTMCGQCRTNPKS